MEIAQEVCNKGSEGDSRHQGEDRSHRTVYDIRGRRREDQRKMHQHGHRDQAEKSDSDRFIRLFLSEKLTEDICSQKRGRIHDIAQCRFQTEERHVLRYLDIRHDDADGNPCEQSDLPP